MLFNVHVGLSTTELVWPTSGARVLEAHYKYVERSCNFFFDKIAQMFLFCRQVSDVHWKESKASRGQSKVVNKIKILFLFFFQIKFQYFTH